MNRLAGNLSRHVVSVSGLGSNGANVKQVGAAELFSVDVKRFGHGNKSIKLH